jgi:hypothetical protein
MTGVIVNYCDTFWEQRLPIWAMFAFLSDHFDRQPFVKFCESPLFRGCVIEYWQSDRHVHANLSIVQSGVLGDPPS